MDGQLDDRAAEIARVGGDTRHQRACDAVFAKLRLDKQVLQKNYRSAPAGDAAAATCRHADDDVSIFGFGDERGKAGVSAKAVAQPIGRRRAHRVQRVFALGQRALQTHQRRDVGGTCSTHAKRARRVVFAVHPASFADA